MLIFLSQIITSQIFVHTDFSVGISDQEAGVMSLHFTFESAETLYIYVLGSNFSDTAYYLHDFMLYF